MLPTEYFRCQHQAASVLILRLCNLLDLYRGPEDALRVAFELARLLGQLRVHFANEDRILHAALIAGSDRPAAAFVTRSRTDLTTLSRDIEQFMQRWSSSVLIANDFATFRAELRPLIGRLDDQAERATATLYPIADRPAWPRLSDAA